jgi:hypothetical protein
MSTQNRANHEAGAQPARVGLRKLAAGLAVIAIVLVQTAAAPRAAAEPRPAYFVDRGGPVLHSAQVYLLYWGTAWTNSGISSPTPDQITAEFRWVVTGPYLSGLAEYRNIQPATLRVATVVPTSNPHRGFDDHAVRDFLDTQLDAGVVPEPDSTNQTLYFVLVPPGVSVGGDSSEFNAEHSYFTRHHRRVHYAWTANSDSLGATTGAMSHELVESVTDPEGNAITGLAGSCAGGGWCEIADVCHDTRGTNGATVTTYWSQRARACIAPDLASTMPPPTSHPTTANPCPTTTVDALTKPRRPIDPCA